MNSIFEMKSRKTLWTLPAILVTALIVLLAIVSVSRNQVIEEFRIKRADARQWWWDPQIEKLNAEGVIMMSEQNSKSYWGSSRYHSFKLIVLRNNHGEKLSSEEQLRFVVSVSLKKFPDMTPAVFEYEVGKGWDSRTLVSREAFNKLLRENDIPPFTLD